MTAHFVELLDLLRRRSLRMGSAVEDMLVEACEAVLATDRTLAQRVIARDAEIDAEEVAIESDVIRLMVLFQPMGSDMRLLTTVLKVNIDLERIADCAVNIGERARHLDAGPMEAFNSDLKEIVPKVQRMLRTSLEVYASGNAESARRLLLEDDAVDAFYGDFIRRLTAEACRCPERITTHIDVLSVVKNLERIADHATNIAEHVIFLATGRIVRHRNT